MSRIHELRPQQPDDVHVIAMMGETETGELKWDIHLLNDKEIGINNVLVSSHGHGQLGKKEVETSKLRFFMEYLPGKASQKLEIVIPDVLELQNEFLVSFYYAGNLYDRKYVFPPDTIRFENLQNVPTLEEIAVYAQ